MRVQFSRQEMAFCSYQAFKPIFLQNSQKKAIQYRDVIFYIPCDYHIENLLNTGMLLVLCPFALQCIALSFDLVTKIFQLFGVIQTYWICEITWNFLLHLVNLSIISPKLGYLEQLYFLLNFNAFPHTYLMIEFKMSIQI